MMKKFYLLYLLLILSTSTSLFAQDGTLDESFNGVGYTLTDLSGNFDEANAVIEQPDGKIVIAGIANEQIGLVRYNADGSLDNSFDTDGKVIIALGDYATAEDMVLQDDGKIIIAGVVIGNDEGILLARINPDGSPDTSFDDDGIYIGDFDAYCSSEAYALALQPDGKILVTGYYCGYDFDSYFLARFNADGSPDNDFGNGGFTVGEFSDDFDAEGNAIHVFPDGKILIGGYSDGDDNSSFGLARFNADGSVDAAFGNNGKVENNPSNVDAAAYAMGVQQDGKIVQTGYIDDAVGVGRFNMDGTPDMSFGTNGWVTVSPGANYNEGYALLVQPDGKILVGGLSNDASYNSSFTVIRLLDDGMLDNTFGDAGVAKTNFEDLGAASGRCNDLTFQSDGKILAAGEGVSENFETDMAVARFENNLAVSTNAPTPEMKLQVYPNPASKHLTLEYTLESAEKLSIQLLSSNGQRISTLQAPTEHPPGAYRFTFPLPQTLPGGNYLISVSTDSERITALPFIKK